jgi:starch phosphorylase
VKKSKASMKSIMPHFNSQRMAMDYVRNYYTLARKERLILSGNDYARAKQLAEWRKQVGRLWPQVRVRRLDAAPQEIAAGEALPIRVAAHLNGLAADDFLMECLVGVEAENGDFAQQAAYIFTPGTVNEHGETVFSLDLLTNIPGLQYYKIRLFPFHTALAHRYEMGLMIWL